MKHDVDLHEKSYKIMNHCTDDGKGIFAPRVEIYDENGEYESCTLGTDAVNLIFKIFNESKKLQRNGR